MNLPNVIAPETTQLEEDVNFYKRSISTVASATNLLASTLIDVNVRLWGLPTERLLALMNHIGVQRIENIFSANTVLGGAVNESLDLVDASKTIYKLRAPVTQGRADIVYNSELGLFVVEEQSESSNEE